MHVYMHMQALANYIADQYRNYRNADISVGLRRPVEMCACVQVYTCACAHACKLELARYYRADWAGILHHISVYAG